MSDPTAGTAPPPPAPRYRKWQFVVGAFVAIAALTSPLWGPRIMRELAFFRVRRVEIVGARYAPATELLERLGVDTMRSVWDPVRPLAERVRAHPQVEHVVVTRKLPGTLVVEVTERRPVALIASARGLAAVDERGRLLPLDPSETPVDAPVVKATQADTSVYHLLGAMQRHAPRLFARIGSVTRVGRDEIILRVSDVPVRALTSVTLARLSDIEPVERDLARRNVRPVELDLRYRDQVIARLP